MKVAHSIYWKDISNKQEYFLACLFLSILHTVLIAVGEVLSGVSYLQSILCKVKNRKIPRFQRVEPMTTSYICFLVKDIVLSLNFPVATLMFIPLHCYTHYLYKLTVYLWLCTPIHLVHLPSVLPSAPFPVSRGPSSPAGCFKILHLHETVSQWTDIFLTIWSGCAIYEAMSTALTDISKLCWQANSGPFEEEEGSKGHRSCRSGFQS